jgi:hypothetical protein
MPQCGSKKYREKQESENGGKYDYDQRQRISGKRANVKEQMNSRDFKGKKR